MPITKTGKCYVFNFLYEKNKENVKDRKRLYRENNKEELNEYNKEKLNEYASSPCGIFPRRVPFSE